MNETRASLGREVVSGSEVAAAAADKVIYWRLFSLLYSCGLRLERFTGSGCIFYRLSLSR